MRSSGRPGTQRRWRPSDRAMTGRGHVELVMRFRGMDYERWQQPFAAHEPVRVRHGAVGHRISRSVTDPHEFLAIVEFTSRGGANGYLEDPERLPLQEATMGPGASHNASWIEELHEVVSAETYTG